MLEDTQRQNDQLKQREGDTLRKNTELQRLLLETEGKLEKMKGQTVQVTDVVINILVLYSKL